MLLESMAQAEIPTGIEWVDSDGQPLVENKTIVILHEEVNRFRRSRGLPPLILDGGCCDIGQRWSVKMATTGEFKHGGGEQIIAWGADEVKEAVQLWVNSSGHRAWLLTERRYAGWGFRKGARGVYWSGVFRDKPIEMSK